ncbi:uncharacterized protein LOC124123462 [Haliotis rufescens]|uniref:uncharacterized protein LOC124123462 n=2 Tax=Haliotis TaxID=6452 RepID=UPI001EB01E8E|nr:uncharacterized protein LOC124123462 [Haliotis rufescens]
MQRSSMKPSSMAVGASILKPPKPPRWRDFVDPAPSSHSKDLNKTQDHGDSGKTYCAKSGVHDSGESKIPTPHPQGGSRTCKGLKRVRAKIHRTRSQHVIDEEDLPDGALTMSLAETKPQEFGLRNRQVLDDRSYKEENARRCQIWLESIEKCVPLDEIAYTEGAGEEGVDVEVPEETRWSEDGEPLRPPFNTSASSSEGEEYETYPTRETLVPGLSVGSPQSLRTDKLLKSSSSTCMHDKLIRKKTLPISEDTGLE